jgi:Zn-finger protein
MYQCAITKVNCWRCKGLSFLVLLSARGIWNKRNAIIFKNFAPIPTIVILVRDENRADTYWIEWCHICFYIFCERNTNTITLKIKWRQILSETNMVLIHCEHRVMQILTGTKRILESRQKNLEHSKKHTKVVPTTIYYGIGEGQTLEASSKAWRNFVVHKSLV